MRGIFLTLGFLMYCPAWAHVPALLLPINGTPITSYFLGQSEISRAIYAELTQPEDFFVAQFYVKSKQVNSIEILTPACPQVLSSEEFQPTALILKGDVPWKLNGETNRDFVIRLEKLAIARAESNFAKGQRPQYFEEFAKQNYWVGGRVNLKLRAGLYAIVVFNKDSSKGNFTLGLNEKESWTPDLYKYVGDVLPKISASICDPKGFSGTIIP